MVDGQLVGYVPAVELPVHNVVNSANILTSVPGHVTAIGQHSRQLELIISDNAASEGSASIFT